METNEEIIVEENSTQPDVEENSTQPDVEELQRQLAEFKQANEEKRVVEGQARIAKVMEELNLTFNVDGVLVLNKQVVAAVPIVQLLPGNWTPFIRVVVKAEE